MTPIREILDHPRYREFAAACTEHGKTVLPDSFPWKCMGMSTVEFLRLPLTYQDGRPMEDGSKVLQLAVVRAQERMVEGYWQWWRGWEYLVRRHADQQQSRPIPAVTAGEQGRLF